MGCQPSMRARGASSSCGTSEACRSTKRRMRCRSLPRRSPASGEWPRRGSAASSERADAVAPDRWQRIDELFQGALDCEPAARAAWLAAACAGDEALRAEVESLIEAHEEAGFTGLADEFAAVLDVHEAQAAAGRRIGVYRIDREIGHGGMGRVYLATRADDVYEKRVAIKVV